MTPGYMFKDVTLLVTHYNRSRSLENLLQSFEELNCSFEHIIVSDDGSKPEQIAYLQSLTRKFDFQLLTSDKNRGLGNNLNKGEDAVKTPYTLYVQEDLHPSQAFVDLFPKALDIMNTKSELDIIRFFAYFDYPCTKPFNKDFSEMVFDIWEPGYYKFYKYSDSSHLRRSTFSLNLAVMWKVPTAMMQNTECACPF